MKIVRRPFTLNSRLYSREYDVVRSWGVHLMQIVDYMDRAGGHSRWTRDLSERTIEALRATGFVWEHVADRTETFERAMSMEMARVEYQCRPEVAPGCELFWCQQCDEVMLGGEVAAEHVASTTHDGSEDDEGHNGIYLTYDGYNFERSRVRECKFTWLSSSRTGDDHIDGIWKWPVQNMAYCWALGRLWGPGSGILGGEIEAVFCVGDFKQGTYEPFPEPFEFDLDYEQHELDQNWMMLVANARAMEWL